jgi:hypothetical protein
MRSGKRRAKTSAVFLSVYGGTLTDCKIPQGISENKTHTCTGIPFPKNTTPFFLFPVIPATYPPGITGKKKNLIKNYMDFCTHYCPQSEQGSIGSNAPWILLGQALTSGTPCSKGISLHLLLSIC